MINRTKSQRLFPQPSKLRHGDIHPTQLSSQSHLSDYYNLTHRPKNSKQKKLSLRCCFTFGSLQDHERSINKLQQVIKNLDSHKKQLMKGNQAIENQNRFMMVEICKARNQQERKYIEELVDKMRRVGQLKKQVMTKIEKGEKEKKKKERKKNYDTNQQKIKERKSRSKSKKLGNYFMWKSYC